MLYSQTTRKSSPSSRQMGAGLPPPSPSPSLRAPSIALDHDAKTLLNKLQMMDEVFHVSDDSTERQLRLQLLEERQTALQRLCEMALQRDEDESYLEACHEATHHAAGRARVDTGIVSTPQSIESLPAYDDVGATHSGTAAVPFLTSPSFDVVRVARPRREVAASRREQCGVDPARPNFAERAVAAGGIATGLGEPFRLLSSPSLFERDTLERDRRLVEEFFGVSQEACDHPYAAEETYRPEVVKRETPLPLTLNFRRFDEADTAAKRTSLEENFDVMEEEHLLKRILLQKPQRTVRPPHKTRNVLAPPYDDNHVNETASMAKEDGSCFKRTNDEMDFSTRVSEMQEVVRENTFLHRELEARDVALRDLRRKTESLARHLVKFMRERAQLRSRAEQLEEQLDVANAEGERLQKAAKEQSERTCDDAKWRAAVHTKERELRICEDELSHLREIVDKRVMRTNAVSAQQATPIAVEQVNSDVEDLLHELGVALVSQREAEAHAERIFEELEVAQLQIQLLDKRLVEAERAADAHRLQEIQERLLSDCDFSLASASSSPPLPTAADVASWPMDARRELARLTSYAESVVIQSAESERYAELRVSRERQENDKLRLHCRTCMAKIKRLEEEAESLRREQTVWKLGKRRLHQQFLDVQDDAMMIAGLLGSTGKNAKRVLQSLETSGVDDRVKTEVETFVKNVLRDWDTVKRLLTALQHIDFSEVHPQESEKPPLSTVIKRRRDFVLQAVETALAQKAASTSVTLPPSSSPPPQSQKRQQQPMVAAAPTCFGESLLATDTAATQGIMNQDGKEKIRAKDEEEDGNWGSLHTSEMILQRSLPPGSFLEGKETTVTRESVCQKNWQRERRLSERRVRSMVPPVLTPRVSVLSRTGKDECSSISHYSHDAQGEELPLSPAACQSNLRCEQKSMLFVSETCEVGRDNLSECRGENCKLSSMGEIDKSLCVPAQAAPTVDRNIGETTRVSAQVHEEGVAGVVEGFLPGASPSMSINNEDIEEIVDPIAQEDKTSLCVVMPHTSLVAAAAAAKDAESVEHLPQKAAEQHLQPDAAKSRVEQSLKKFDKMDDTNVGDSDAPPLEKSQTDLVTRSTLCVASGSRKEVKVVKNKVRRDRSNSLHDAHSEPRLKPAPVCANKAKSKESRPSQQATSDVEKEETVLLAVGGQVAASTSDVPCAHGTSADQAPTLSRPSSGRRSEGCAASLKEPQPSSVTRPVFSSLSEEELTASAAEAALTDVKSAVGQGLDASLRRRVSASMDFPSLRHPRLALGSQPLQGSGEETSESLDTEQERS